ncbi:MAG: NHL repeat-containing protein [Planctomycetota bacterium]|nr:NHL repeat-containing protein [Planctomycetota bacterium]MDP6762027.1 NHL repeat-containing protein [Planctomycetota bacterium]
MTAADRVRAILAAGAVVGALAARAGAEPAAGFAGQDEGPPVVRFYNGELSALRQPVAAAMGEGGTVWVVEEATRTLAVFDAKRSLVRRTPLVGEGEVLTPGGVALGPDGSLFVSDAVGGRVGVFDGDGLFERWIGAGLLGEPRGLDVEGERLWVADAGSHRVEVFATDGRALGGFGGAGTAPGRLLRPVDVAATGDGRAWVADFDNDRVQLFDADGRPLLAVGDFGPFPGLFAGPAAVEWRDGRLFVADHANHRVQVLDGGGEALFEFGVHALLPREGEGRLHYPVGLAVDAAGLRAVVVEALDDRCQLFGVEANEAAGEELAPPPISPTPTAHLGRNATQAASLLAVDSPEEHCVLLYDIDWREPRLISRVGGRGVKTGLFRRPAGVVLDGEQGRLFVSDPTLRRLSVFELAIDPEAEVGWDPLIGRFVKSLDFVRLFEGLPEGTLGAPPEPGALTRAEDGRLFVCDRRNDRVLVLGADLSLAGSVGGRGFEPGRLRGPTGVALDGEAETLFVADAGNRRVQAFALPAGELSRVIDLPAGAVPHGVAFAGEGELFVTDVAGARILRFDAASGAPRGSIGGEGLGRLGFHKPRGITVNRNGDLLVMDHGNHRGQTVTADGRFVGVFGPRLYIKPARSERPAQEEEE